MTATGDAERGQLIALAFFIPQDANGYGTPSGQFLSFTTA